MQQTDCELWMRYADGELHGEEWDRATERLQDDDEARQFVDDLSRQRAVLPAAILQDDEPRMLASFEVTIDREFARRRRQRRVHGVARWGMPLAASVLVAAIISVVGLRMADERIAAAVDTRLAALQQDRTLMAVTLDAALETRLSGQQASWSNPDSGSEGTVTPLRTYRNSAGTWCREFEQIVSTPIARDASVGVACRRDEGGWRIAMERPADV